MKLEKSLQGKILKDLRSYGKHVVAFKIMQTSDNGVPDIFFTSSLTGGVFIEVKRSEKEELRALQKFMVEKLNKCGSKSFPCKTWEEWVSIKSKLGFSLQNITSKN